MMTEVAKHVLRKLETVKSILEIMSDYPLQEQFEIKDLVESFLLTCTPKAPPARPAGEGTT